jgi:hypothetical protein
MAMAIALAAFAVNSDGLPARLRHSGMGEHAQAHQSPRLRQQPEGDAEAEAAAARGAVRPGGGGLAQVRQLQRRTPRDDRPRCGRPGQCRRSQGDAGDAAQKRFDPDVYFAKAPKAFALVAIEDVFGRKEAEFSASTGKQDLVAYAVENCPPAKWLPIELRPEGYAGPGAKKKPASKAAAKKAVKKGKR